MNSSPYLATNLVSHQIWWWILGVMWWQMLLIHPISSFWWAPLDLFYYLIFQNYPSQLQLPAPSALCMHIIANHCKCCSQLGLIAKHISLLKVFKLSFYKSLVLMSQRRLFPSVLILVLFSFFLTHFFFLPIWLDEVPPASLPSCWNITSPKSPAEIFLWEMFKRLLASLEVRDAIF